ANLPAAVSLKIAQGQARVGISVTENFLNATVQVFAKGKSLANFTRDLAPGVPLVEPIALPEKIRETDLSVRVADHFGGEIISYQIKPRGKGKVPPPATEPLPPGEISSADELFITGLHLDQYRHATRCPTDYWREALRRDPLDSRCNNALGLWHLRRGEFADAEQHFRRAIERLTCRNANPCDGDAFYKSVWNQAWMAAGYHALAEIDGTRNRWEAALENLNRSLRFNTDNLRA